MLIFKNIAHINFLTSLLIYGISFVSVGQVKIATSAGTPSASAMIDVESSNRGFLLPRIALSSSTMQLNGTTPADGMMIFNSNDVTTNNLKGAGVYIYYGNSWRLLQEYKNLDPVGVYKYSATNTLNGYLKCDGSAVSRSGYSALFSLIGTAFGSGDGSTTFNLPDLRGRIYANIGAGSGLPYRSLAGIMGSETTSLNENYMPVHRHLESLAADGNDGSFGNTRPTVFSESIGGNPNLNASVAWTSYEGGGPINLMQPTMFAGSFFIKY
ncbi:phage tail protein [uncultured Pedobacter sp.]|uniref:phage tail protein n=1 Tax=uncultured Pedobacter sp. TaxID=246139 RepID=UPI0025E78212|nr:phage tail protein [uncultured Pedobacter sp.]